MKNNTIIFRTENKYLISTSQYNSFISLSTNYISMDSYGSYNISSIYFDTDEFNLARFAIKNINDNKKYRLRTYGNIPITNDSMVFWECKEKKASKTHKTRVKLCFNDFSIDKRKYYSNDLNNSITPKIQINYTRQAYICPTNLDLRITIDFDVISFKNNTLDFNNTDNIVNLLPNNTFLLEVKYSEQLPHWLNIILDELSICPVDYSKYICGYRKLISG